MWHISILGNIGSGKTTLAKRLEEGLPGFTAILEPDVQQNPYLTHFLHTPCTYALHNQLYFLLTALETLNSSLINQKTVADHSILSCLIFAEALMRHGLLSRYDYSIYEGLCKAIIANLTAPSLYIVVRASVATLMLRIQERGRSSETTISCDYLATLQTLHDTKLIDSWIPTLAAPTIFVDTDKCDLRSHNDRVCEVIRTVSTALASL